MSNEMNAPVVVTHKGRRYLLTAGGVTKAAAQTDLTRRVDECGVVIGPWSDSNRRPATLRWQ